MFKQALLRWSGVTAHSEVEFDSHGGARLAHLETELLNTAEELGRAKKELSVKAQQLEDLKRQATRSHIEDRSAVVRQSEVERLVQTEVARTFATRPVPESSQLTTSSYIPTADSETVKQLRSELVSSKQEYQQLQRILEQERIKASELLRHERDNSSQLANRLLMVEKELGKPPTPAQEHYNVGIVEFRSETECVNSLLYVSDVGFTVADTGK
jgi:small-conductance mechanosensitive channel